VQTCFGTETPHSSQFLVHVGLHEPTAEGTPVLFVPGAGDNGSRGFITLATRLDRINRPVFALTFAHPHGDVFQQAEIVADAVALIKERTQAELVDVVGHSKGGIAATVYASNHTGATWGRPDYAQHGTPYRGDIRRLLLIATPLGGVDTSYRWPGLNLVALDPDTALNPTSWDRYYPSSTALPLVYDDLSDQDMMPDGRDLFPGQRQLLARQGAPLPGESTWLGLYALQPDWLTTYEGGLGFQSRSDGIDAAIAQGGDLIAKLEGVGVDPSIEVYLLGGTHPLMPNGDADFADQFASFGEIVDWSDLLDAMDDHGIPVTTDADELDGLERGWLVLGEATGVSDGLVFVQSALKEAAVDARGAAVVERKVAELSHLDLLYASPITGDLLIQAADAGGPDEQWMRGVGERYKREDTLGWIEEVLSDPDTGTPGTTDTGDTGLLDTTDGEPAIDDDPEDYPRPCGGCDAGGRGASLWLPALGLLVLRRRGRPD
jgi:pimeloyl-ACP methyl ester carboxylesterase